MKLQHIQVPVKAAENDIGSVYERDGTELCRCYGMVEDTRHKSVEIELAVNFFDKATYALLAWQTLAEESLDFRLALANLPDNIGVQMLELTNEALAQAGIAPYCEGE